MNTKKHTRARGLWPCLLLLMGPGLDAFAQSPLTFNQMVGLLESEVDDSVIIKQIEKIKVDFDLTLQNMPELVRKGASDAILNAIRNNRFVYLCEEIPPTHLRPELAPQFKDRLEGVNIVLSDVKADEVMKWLAEDLAYQALACLCFRVMAEKKLKSRLPLDVINERYRKGKYIPARDYNDDERLRNAILNTWNKRYEHAAGFNEIVESLGGQSP